MKRLQQEYQPMRRIFYRPRQIDAEDGKYHIRKEEPSLARICSGCGAISLEKRWFFDKALKEELINSGQFEYECCPGCAAVEAEEVGGVVLLSGGFLEGRTDELLKAIQHEEEELRADNPASMIINIASSGENIVIRTANPFMAERIGKKLKKAYDGELAIIWSHEDRLVRVYWSREE